MPLGADHRAASSGADRAEAEEASIREAEEAWIRVVEEVGFACSRIIFGLSN